MVRRGDGAVDSVQNVAQWLVDHAIDVLHWPSADDASFRRVQATADVWSGRVAAAVELAEMAAELAGEGQADREAAFCGGLLYYAADWLRCDVARFADSSSQTSFPFAAPAVEAAAKILAGKTRGRAAEAADRWRRDSAGPADWLPQLAARMARLATLEKSFAETLENEKLAALAEFAAGAGHEINNPLTVIAGRAQLFLREESDPERRRGLALINAQAMRVYEMIADLRLFARPPRPEFQSVDVSTLMDRVIAELSPAAADDDILLSRDGEAGLVVEADPTQLLVAVRALCQNAIHAIGSARTSDHRRKPQSRRSGNSRLGRRSRHFLPGPPAHFRPVLFRASGGPWAGAWGCRNVGGSWPITAAGSRSRAIPARERRSLSSYRSVGRQPHLLTGP